MNNSDLNTVFGNTADSIREKLGTQDGIKPEDFAEEIGKISGGGELTDEIVIQYLEDKLNYMNFPETLADGDLVFDGGYLINTNLGISKADYDEKAYIALSTINPNFTITNVSDKDYLISYDNLDFKQIEAHKQEWYGNTISGTFIFDPNKLIAYDLSTLEKDNYKATFTLPDNKVSTIYIQTVQVGNNYVLKYSCNADELVAGGFNYYDSIDLFRIESNPTSSSHLGGYNIGGQGETTTLTSVTVNNTNDFYSHLFSYITCNWEWVPSYTLSNDMEVYKYSEDTGEYSIKVDSPYRLLNKIEQNEFNVQSFGMYLREDYTECELMIRLTNIPEENYNINVKYYIADELISSVYIGGMSCWDEISYIQINRQDLDNIDINEDNYKFVIEFTSNQQVEKVLNPDEITTEDKPETFNINSITINESGVGFDMSVSDLTKYSFDANFYNDQDEVVGSLAITENYAQNSGYLWYSPIGGAEVINSITRAEVIYYNCSVFEDSSVPIEPIENPNITIESNKVSTNGELYFLKLLNNSDTVYSIFLYNTMEGLGENFYNSYIIADHNTCDIWINENQEYPTQSRRVYVDDYIERQVGVEIVSNEYSGYVSAVSDCTILSNTFSFSLSFSERISDTVTIRYHFLDSNNNELFNEYDSCMLDEYNTIEISNRFINFNGDVDGLHSIVKFVAEVEFTLPEENE